MDDVIVLPPPTLIAAGEPASLRLPRHFAARRVIAALDSTFDDGGYVGRQGDSHPFDLGPGWSS